MRPSLHLLPLLIFLIFSPSPSLSLSVQGPVGYGYKLVAVHPDSSTRSMVAYLHVIQNSSVYGPDIQNLMLVASYETNERLRIRITDLDRERWEVPQTAFPRPPPISYDLLPEKWQHPSLAGKYIQFAVDESDLVLYLYSAVPFGFSIKRRSTGDTIFNTLPRNPYSTAGIVFKDQYIEISSSLPADRASIYGLGEHTKKTFRRAPNETMTMWNNDILALKADMNLYGSQPFYMDVRSAPRAGATHGVLLLNSNGMDVVYGGSFITYKVIGGVLDFYFFEGPSPVSVMDQYTAFVGRPAAMPYWSFGLHQCRFGIQNMSYLEEAVDGYTKADLPLEAMWTDIDYMEDSKDFTLDPIRFPADKMKKYIDRLHRNGQKYVIMVEPAIAVNNTYGTYLRGLEADIYIKRNGTPYVGEVWPGPSHFADFLNPAAAEFWYREISIFKDIIQFDGIWLDMNEIANLITSPPDPSSPLDNPPYKINNRGGHLPLGMKTIPPSALHYGNVTEYDAHNLYGLLETKATREALIRINGKRPFILSRSNFPGFGKHAAHWTGDIGATWTDLANSIPAILSTGLFGIPMVGADICGFNGGTTEELCRRWVQVGAFYPFARDHSDKYFTRQELYFWDSVKQSAKTVLSLRYRLLPYYYTLMYEATLRGTPIARPLFFSFPNDERTYGISTQFLIGRGVMLSPVLRPKMVSVNAYFPAGNWFNLFNYTRSVSTAHGENVTLDTPGDAMNAHIRGGNILVMQGMAMTTRAARRTGFELLVVLDEAGNATGEVYLDDDDEVEMGGKRGTWSLVKFISGGVGGEGVEIRSKVVNGKFALKQEWEVKKVVVLGLKVRPRRERVSWEVSGEELDQVDGVRTSCDWNGSFGIAKIEGLSLLIGKEFEMKLGFEK